MIAYCIIQICPGEEQGIRSSDILQHSEGRKVLAVKLKELNSIETPLWTSAEWIPQTVLQPCSGEQFQLIIFLFSFLNILTVFSDKFGNPCRSSLSF